MYSNYTTVSEQLEALPYWVCWTKNKIPLDAKTGKQAKANDPKTWSDFPTAQQYAIQHEVGLGFEFGTGNKLSGIAGIDVDHCLIESGELSELAKDILSIFPDCYTERSPSGTGLHILIYGSLPDKARHKIKELGLEVYDRDRYFTITGNLLPGASNVIRNGQNELNEFYRKYFPLPDPAPVKVQRPQSQPDFSDAALIDKITKSKQGSEFTALWAGDTSRHGGDDSAADLALANILAFWTGKDVGKMDSLFRQSGLYRDKWDREDYRTWTLNKAVNDCRNVYDPKAYQSVTLPPDAKDKQTLPKIKCECFTAEGQFLPPILAEAISNQYFFVYQFAQLYVYCNGVYQKTDVQFIKQICLNTLHDRYRDNRGAEVARYITTKIYSLEPFFTGDLRYINFKNGLLDWQNESPVLYTHSPEFHSNIQIPVTYNPAATCPKIDKFFADVLPPDCINLVYEFFGYCLLPITKLQIAFLLKSGGDSGKSVFLFLLQAFLGNGNYSSEALQSLSENRFRAANLAGKLANIFADIPATAIEDSSVFKALVGGDTITAERKGKDPFTFKNTARLVFSCNELPRTKDNSYGFFKRWVIIPFPHQFLPNNPIRDPFLIEKITTDEELSGLLNHAIEGLKRLMARGKFEVPLSCQGAINEYILMNDSSKAFLHDCVEISADSRIKRADLYEYYKNFCIIGEMRPVRDRKFNEKVREFFPEIQELKNSDHFWVGIKMTDTTLFFSEFH